MSVKNYTKWIGFMSLICGLAYIKFVTVLIWDFIYKICFAISILAFITLGWIETADKKRSRKFVNALVISIYPFMIFDAASFLFVSSNVVKLTSIMLVVTIILAMLMAGINCVRTQKDRFYIYLKKYICLLMCIVVLPACIYGRKEIKNEVVFSVETEYEETTSTDENSLGANIEIIAMLDPKNGWNDYKKDAEIVSKMIEAIVRVECRYLGMTDSYPKIEFAYLEETKLGCYHADSDTITVSYGYLRKCTTGYEILEVVCHEMMHRYQSFQVEMLNALEANETTKKFADLKLLYKIPEYREEMNNYISGEEDMEEYSDQSMEEDAYMYGKSAVRYYFEQIQKFLDIEE